VQTESRRFPKRMTQRRALARYVSCVAALCVVVLLPIDAPTIGIGDSRSGISDGAKGVTSDYTLGGDGYADHPGRPSCNHPAITMTTQRNAAAA
ncbi:hypothetical protein, partial [Acidiphilium sp.]|uniref:hypothetical protein n=1 Tax=Acidiphilium sp. TaxID=527 RepID=UPI00259103F6